MSKEGKLGVEGMETKIIMTALEKAGVLYDENSKKEGKEITHTDFFEDGISGGENSSRIRKAFAKQLGLPELISSSALLKIINSYMTYEEYKEVINSMWIN
jgi:ribonuclease M5